MFVRVAQHQRAPELPQGPLGRPALLLAPFEVLDRTPGVVVAVDPHRFHQVAVHRQGQMRSMLLDGSNRYHRHQHLVHHPWLQSHRF